MNDSWMYVWINVIARLKILAYFSGLFIWVQYISFLILTHAQLYELYF